MKFGDGTNNKNPTLFQASPAGEGDVGLVLYSLLECEEITIIVVRSRYHRGQPSPAINPNILILIILICQIEEKKIFSLLECEEITIIVVVRECPTINLDT